MKEHLKIGLIGYGRMGKKIEELCEATEAVVVFAIDRHNLEEMRPELLKSADVALEFTHPESAPRNLIACFDAGVPVVTGTTGWNDQLPDILEACKSRQGGLFYASNFSIGVNLLFRINRLLSSWAHLKYGYSASIREVHHVHKRDAPSGTALSLAGDILNASDQYSAWSMKSVSKDNELRIESIREGEVPGIHEVRFSSQVDELTIRHEAFSREGFALGALAAARFMAGKTGVYGMDDLLNEG